MVTSKSPTRNQKTPAAPEVFETYQRSQWLRPRDMTSLQKLKTQLSEANPLTAADNSAIQRGLLDFAIAHCKDGDPIWDEIKARIEQAIHPNKGTRGRPAEGLTPANTKAKAKASRAT